MTLKEFVSYADRRMIVKVELTDISSDDVILKDTAYNIENNPKSEKMFVDYFADTRDGIVVFVTEQHHRRNC